MSIAAGTFPSSFGSFEHESAGHGVSLDTLLDKFKGELPFLKGKEIVITSTPLTKELQLITQREEDPSTIEVNLAGIANKVLDMALTNQDLISPSLISESVTDVADNLDTLKNGEIIMRGLQVLNKTQYDRESGVNATAFEEGVLELMNREDGSFEELLLEIDDLNNIPNLLDDDQLELYERLLVENFTNRPQEELARYANEHRVFHTFGYMIMLENRNGYVVPVLIPADFELVGQERDSKGRIRLIQKPLTDGQVIEDEKREQAPVMEESVTKAVGSGIRGRDESGSGQGSKKPLQIFAAIATLTLIAGLYFASKANAQNVKPLNESDSKNPVAGNTLGADASVGNVVGTPVKKEPQWKSTPTAQPTVVFTSTPKASPTVDVRSVVPNYDKEVQAGNSFYASKMNPNYIYMADTNKDIVSIYDRATGSLLKVSKLPDRLSRGKIWPGNTQAYINSDGELVEFVYGGMPKIQYGQIQSPKEFQAITFQSPEDGRKFLEMEKPWGTLGDWQAFADEVMKSGAGYGQYVNETYGRIPFGKAVYLNITMPHGTFTIDVTATPHKEGKKDTLVVHYCTQDKRSHYIVIELDEGTTPEEALNILAGKVIVE